VTQLLGNHCIVLGADFEESPSNGIPDTTVKLNFSTGKLPYTFVNGTQTQFVNNVPSVLGAGVSGK